MEDPGTNPLQPTNPPPTTDPEPPSAVAEIPQVIHSLTQTPPSLQRATLERYFTPSASFIHPLCRTGSFTGSRWFIWCIYRWYKIMSPHIDITIDSVGESSNPSPPANQPNPHRHSEN